MKPSTPMRLPPTEALGPWCLECGRGLNGSHAFGATLDPACRYCAQRAATGHVTRLAPLPLTSVGL
jgi:hypothetical protein